MGIRKISSSNKSGVVRSKTRVIAMGIVAVAIVAGGSVLIGKSDTGEIDVTAAIQNSNITNEKNNGGQEGNVNPVPEALRNMPNGGLVPTEKASEPEVVPEASTTEEDLVPVDSASTTDNVPADQADQVE
ncbi:MAG: hypothetical protein K9M10_02855 [Candidatus Pacebacteria bacterium]|nr:hypothetical protein [Candidatus Paceibacterota bacterium]MCF7857392.1 hypothetical protein [Candidatus Paceibacterota bacterium]